MWSPKNRKTYVHTWVEEPHKQETAVFFPHGAHGPSWHAVSQKCLFLPVPHPNSFPQISPHVGIGSKQLLRTTASKSFNKFFPHGHFVTTSGDRSHGLQSPLWHLLVHVWFPHCNIFPHNPPHENPSANAVNLDSRQLTTFISLPQKHTFSTLTSHASQSPTWHFRGHTWTPQLRDFSQTFSHTWMDWDEHCSFTWTFPHAQDFETRRWQVGQGPGWQSSVQGWSQLPLLPSFSQTCPQEWGMLLGSHSGFSCLRQKQRYWRGSSAKTIWQIIHRQVESATNSHETSVKPDLKIQTNICSIDKQHLKNNYGHSHNQDVTHKQQRSSAPTPMYSVVHMELWFKTSRY